MSKPLVNNVLLIDDSVDTRNLLIHFFNGISPETKITEYDPIESGKPSASFNWSEFDLLILDYDLGNGENGLEWLREFKTSTEFPATLILTAKDDEELVVKAQKYGAQGFIRKEKLSKKWFIQVIQKALEEYLDQTMEAISRKVKVHHYNKEKFLELLKTLHVKDAIALLKIDGFNEISEKLEAEETDKFVKFLTDIIQETIVNNGMEGTFTRIKESVIGILLHNREHAAIEQFAKKLCEEFDQSPFQLEGAEIDYSISLGLVEIKGGKSKVSELLQAVDSASATARKQNGNSYAFASEETKIDETLNTEMAKEIISAVKEEHFVPLFQPLVQISDAGHPLYSELYQTTTNLIDSQGSSIDPKEFLPILEKTNMLNTLDRWVSRHCIVELSKLNRKENRNFGIFVSLSKQSQSDKELSDWLDKIIKRLKMPDLGKYIIFEINAADFLENMREAKMQLNKLRIKLKSPIALTHIEDLETLDKCLQAEKFDFVFFSPEHNSRGKMDAGLIQNIASQAKENGAISVASKIDSGEYMMMATSSGVDYVLGLFVQPPMENILSSEEVVV